MPIADVQLSLLCRAGGLLCALPVDRLVETLRLPPLEVLSDTPQFVLGIAIVRGAGIPVVSVGRLLSGNSDPPNRLVVARVGNRQIGLAVDEVVGFRSLTASMLRNLPPLLSDASTSAIAEIATLDGALMLLLDATRLVPDEVFALMDAKAVAS